MKNRGLVLAAGALLGMSSAAMAQFTALNAGPLDSNGPAGNALNGMFTFNYAGPAFSPLSIDFSGALTEVNTGTFASEARWRVTNPAGAFADFQMSTTSGFTGTLNIATTLLTGSPFNNAASSVGLWTFQAFESFDDGSDLLTDATWSNISFTFNNSLPPPPPPPVSTFIGNYPAGVTSIDTFTSSYDTELGLYDSNGVLLASNDDSGGLQSLISPGALANGTYYIALGGFNTTYGGVFGAVGGAGAGNYVLNVDGSQVLAGTSSPNQIVWASFTVPAPGAVALMGMGGLLAARRRR